MKKEIVDALNTITQGLSNPHYFEETRPINYDITAYCISCGTEPSDRELEREWTSIVLPRLKASNVKVFQETATRLEREWRSQKRARQGERTEEEEDNRMRKLLIRAKFEHRAATLDHSSNTLARDFQAFDRSPIAKNAISSSSACRTPPFLQGSSSPESPSQSPVAPPKFAPPRGNKDEESHAFFNSAGSLQDIILGSLRDGCSLPSWAKDRPLHTFKMQLRHDWGPRVTDLYEAAKAKPILDHIHIDEIALLSGIVHLNKNHVGFSELEIKSITREVLESFYSQEMKDEDIQRAQDATLLWANWVQKWKTLLLSEKVAAQREDRDSVGAVDTEPVVEAILSSYTECKSKKITAIFFIALHAFRHYSTWASLLSESDCLMAVVGPILNEIMALQHKIKFTCANACTSVGKTRKVQLQQDGQSRQPDIIGQTESKEEVFYGELKGPHPKTAAVNTDILRLAIFSKDSLDQLHNMLVQGPPLLTFQSVGRDVTFFLGTKVDNTIVHVHLSTVRLPTRLSEMDLDYEFFFHLFQVQTLISVAKDRLENKRVEPLQEVFFPTLGTPERNAALRSSLDSRK
ncbi:unnamed protein product [Mortierella alpina]